MKRRNRSKISPRLRERVFARAFNRCENCGTDGNEHNPLTVEHKVPLDRNGSNKISNLACWCRSCNRGKGNLTPEEYARMMA